MHQLDKTPCSFCFGLLQCATGAGGLEAPSGGQGARLKQKPRKVAASGSLSDSSSSVKRQVSFSCAIFLQTHSPVCQI